MVRKTTILTVPSNLVCRHEAFRDSMATEECGNAVVICQIHGVMSVTCYIVWPLTGHNTSFRVILPALRLHQGIIVKFVQASQNV
jgi:hypothetical protein